MRVRKPLKHKYDDWIHWIVGTDVLTSINYVLLELAMRLKLSFNSVKTINIKNLGNAQTNLTHAFKIDFVPKNLYDT